VDPVDPDSDPDPQYWLKAVFRIRTQYLRNEHLSTLIRYSRVPIKGFVYLATIPMFQIPIKRTKHFELGGEKKRKGQMIQF